VRRFMNRKEVTPRKDLVTKFRSPQAVDRLIGVGILRTLDNDGNLAPTAFGVARTGATHRRDDFTDIFSRTVLEVT